MHTSGHSALLRVAFQHYDNDLPGPAVLFTLAATSFRAHPRLELLIDDSRDFTEYEEDSRCRRIAGLPQDLRRRLIVSYDHPLTLRNRVLR